MVRFGRGFPMNGGMYRRGPIIMSHVLFDAVGAGTGSGTNVSPATWSHTAAAGSDVFIWTSNDQSGSNIGTVTYGGTAVPLLTSLGFNNNTTNGTLQVFRLRNAPGGTQTVSIPWSGAWLNADSISYANVHTVGTPQTAFGSGTSLSQSATGTLILQAFGGNTHGAYGPLTPSGGTNRYNGSASGLVNLTISDAANSATFTATALNANDWAGIALPLS
jgi:hypothetical protein